MLSASNQHEAGRMVGDRRGFVWRTRVHFDELDAMGMLHNARYALLLERASSAFFESNGWRWARDPAENADAHHVVREQTVRYVAPIAGTTDVEVEMWVDRVGQSSASLCYELRSIEGIVHATARRVIVKLDPVTYKPVAWTPRLRDCLRSLVRASV